MADPLTLGVLGGSALLGVGGSLFQNKLGRDNMEYQWENYYSPQAQVRNMAKAGINPAVAFGNQSPTLSSGGQLQMPDAPNFGVGTTAINELGSYFKSLADAKKAGAEEKNIGVQTEKALTEIEANKLNNSLLQEFGRKKWVNELSLAYQNVLLAKKTNDIKEQEKAIIAWESAKRKAEAECSEKQRDILQKHLDNTDNEIRLENKLKEEKIQTEKSSQSANYASANASNTQADINKEIKKLRSIEREISETGKMDKIDEYLSELKRNKMLNDKEYEEFRAKFLSLKNRNEFGDKNQWYRNFYNILDDVETYLSKINPLKGMFSDLH